MTETANALDVAVIGAGPYGLSVAAHLAPQARVRVFGPPMETWRTLIPPDMLLRSEWEHTNLSAPHGEGTLSRWSEETGDPPVDPIPVQAFLRYSSWFIERFVPTLDRAKIAGVTADSEGYRLRTVDGRSFTARSVVVATGITPFAHRPEVFKGFDAGLVSSPLDPLGPDELAGRRVAVIGGGQNAMEAALRASRAGAERVDVLVRSTVRWFAEREPYQERGRLAGFVYRLAYPISGFGPPPINRLVLHPELFALLPERARGQVSARLLRAGGSPWLRQQLEGAVTFHERALVSHVQPGAEGARLTLADGRELEVDRIVVACGFRFDLESIPFLDETVRSRISTDAKTGWPLLSGELESTAAGIYFAGYPAEGRFGPIVRFIEGTRFSAERCAASLRRRTRSAPLVERPVAETIDANAA